MRIRSFVLWLLLLAGGFSANAQQPARSLPKMPAQPLQEDVILLKKILEANHPSLYWYISKDSLDACFNDVIGSITDSLNEVQFKNKVAWLVSKIRCGHTAVRFSKAYGKVASSFRYPLFPLAIKTWQDSLVVLSSILPKDSIFKRGTVITSINGMSNRSLLDTIFRFISTDGYADNYKSQLISGNFAGWLKTILGIDSTYTISYIDTAGHEATTVIRSFSPDTSTQSRKIITAARPFPPGKPTRKQLRQANLLNKRAMVIDTANSTAFIRLTTFTGGRLRSFFRRSFKTMRKQHIKNLVIDMRENGGGNVGNSITLTRYLADTAFKIGDSVTAISRSFKYGRYIKPAWIYWLAMRFTAHKAGDGLIHAGRYERHYFKPKTRNHFNGNVYLVQGGLTFSAATMCIATLQGQSNIKVVGEETGGGYYGNSAMHIPVITLPNSGLQVSLPMYRLVMDASRPKGHGIIPDIIINPSSEAIKKGVDLKIEAIKEMIRKSNAVNDPH